MRKREHWRRELMEWAQHMVGTPFHWGISDCTTLALGAIRVMCGSDGARQLEPRVRRYTTRWGALRVQRESGGAARVLESCGFIPYPVTFAQTGDLIVCAGEPRGLTSVFICLDNRELGSDETRGVQLVKLPRRELADAFAYRILV